MNLRKAQTATEYLIILAVVVIIALITVGVLGIFPTLSGTTDVRTSATYWASADVGITSFAVAASQNATFVIKNNQRNAIRVNTMKVHLGPNADTTVMGTSVNLGPGKTNTVSYNLTSTSTDANRCQTAGDSFSFTVTFNYTDLTTGATYLFNGDGNQLKGTCAQ